MSERSSGWNESSLEICPSASSCDSTPSEAHQWSALSSRIFHPRSDSGVSSLLPSDSCKYLTWHKIKQHDIQGSQLRCPRVREGPAEDDVSFTQMGCALTPVKRVLGKNKWEKWLQENWEDCTNLNISFQDLGDAYQVENFNRILRRLIRVETLWLVDNSLVDLSAIRLPSCRILNMNKNHLTSFKQLPKIPQIQHLSLAENHIETLTGLSSLQCTPLESLTLKRNPCEFHQNYRKRVFSCLPNLKILDGILKLPEDYSPPETSIFSKMCIVS
ncbi:acidic leucine-rich nuclear phosphoprotein 32-related protein [Oryctolagus cuniculus]|uniref:acidic leucine-rich nuclear phosphoprotein 32-related protein n=1 Tax=Oryctolagus cuniculus TaxID=9986 RepID=UPI0038791885